MNTDLAHGEGRGDDRRENYSPGPWRVSIIKSIDKEKRTVIDSYLPSLLKFINKLTVARFDESTVVFLEVAESAVRYRRLDSRRGRE